MVDYDHQQYAQYPQGRALPAETVAMWRQVFARHAPATRPLTVLDLGCGVGRFTPTLADEFGGPVYGVEPSERMREIAEERAGHPAVTYLSGEAEHIPLPEASCELALMFLVLHHLRDRPTATREIARVLRPDGRLLIRSTFADRMPDLLWHRYFPRAREIELRMFPSVPEVLADFAAAGLAFQVLDTVAVTLAPDLATYRDQLANKAISVFEYLSEEETEQGFAALSEAVAAGAHPGPVTIQSDLLVLSRGGPDEGESLAGMPSSR